MLKKQIKLCSILGASVMSHSIRSDPLCHKTIHTPSQSSSSSSNSGVLRLGNRVNGGLSLVACFDSSNHKTGAIAPQRVRYVDIGLDEEGCTDARLVNGRRSGYIGKPLDFGHPLTEKLAVAVDVDEGIVFSLFLS